MTYAESTEGRILHWMHNGRGIDTPYGDSANADELREAVGCPDDFGSVLAKLEREGRIGIRRNAHEAIVALAMRW